MSFLFGRLRPDWWLVSHICALLILVGASHASIGADTTASREADGGQRFIYVPPRLLWQPTQTADEMFYVRAQVSTADTTVTSTRMMFLVDKRGHTRGCTVIKASGSAKLDAFGCHLIAGFVYKPAKDGSGKHVPSYARQSICWASGKAVGDPACVEPALIR